MPVTVSTKSRLERIVRPFELVVSKSRKFAPGVGMVPSIVSVACDSWQESSVGDSMHKVILVLKGQVDIEGMSGGWLVIPNHIIFVPAHRSFNLRTTRKAHVVVVHLHPDDHLWHHHGCWVTQANALAVQYSSYVLSASTREAGNSVILRQLLRTFSLMCRDWFANTRILWLPSAKSDELRLFVNHVRGNLSCVTVAEACKACKLAPRTLQRLSQQEFSFGLKTLITEVRMMRAMELLVSGDLSVGAVASSVGFSSLGSFTSAFSQRIGVSPGEFKQKNAASLRSCRALIG